MKPRSTEYDQWMKLLKAIQPPFHEGGCEDESEWDKYYDCSFEMRFVRNDGTVVASAAHWTGADAFEASERYITDIMDIVREEEGDEYDYSDPDDAKSVFAARLDEIGESLATVLDELRNHRNQMDINWSAVAEANSLLAITDAVRQTATAFISNNT